MEAMRQSWSDDRLDDLNLEVDRGFENVDKRFEQVDKRFEQVDKRFEQFDQRLQRLDERLYREFLEVHKEIRGLSENLHRAIVQSMIGIVAFMAAGFAGILGIIATQL